MNDEKTRQALLEKLCARPLISETGAVLREQMDQELAKPDAQVDWDQVDRWVEEICCAEGQEVEPEIPSVDALIAKAKGLAVTTPLPTAARRKTSSHRKRRTMILIAACIALLVTLGVAGISAENPGFFLFEDFIQWTSDGVVFNFTAGGTPTTRPAEEVSSCKQDLRKQALEECGIANLDIPEKLLEEHTATIKCVPHSKTPIAYVKYEKNNFIISCQAQLMTEQDDTSVKLLGEYTRGETFTAGDRTIYLVQKQDKVAALYVRDNIRYVYFSDYDWDTTKDYLTSLSDQ